MAEAKILLVEDDPNLGFVISDRLIHAGYEVILCRDGEEGLSTFGSQDFNLCLLDVMLPKKDGITLAKEIRVKNPSIPILFLTAKNMQDDKIEGFKTGADDYITKPFNMEELIYRIEVFLRRSGITGSSTYPKAFKLGSYTFYYHKLLLAHENEEKILTQREADVLKYLCENQGVLLKREDILTTVWGDDDYFMGRSMDVFISRLRKYLRHENSVEIKNFHSVGFILETSNREVPGSI